MNDENIEKLFSKLKNKTNEEIQQEIDKLSVNDMIDVLTYAFKKSFIEYLKTESLKNKCRWWK